MLEDINLEEIIFTPNNNGIKLTYSSMYTGVHLGQIECRHVFLFKFQNTLEENDAFPCYIAKIDSVTLTKDRLRELLLKFGFSFKNADGTLYQVNSDSYQHLHLASGEVVIDILASKVSFVNLE